MIKDAIEIIKQYYPLLLKGTGNALLFAFSGTAIGFVIGLLFGIIRSTPKSEKKIIKIIQKIINGIITIYTEVFRGTPMMVQSMVIYWGFAFANNGKTLDLTLAGILIVSINTGAYMTEIVRGGIISIDKGQFEGAYSIGMNHFQTMIHVVIPQMLKNIIPSAANELLNNIKDSSVLNVIGVTELYYFSNVIKRTNLMVFETYLVTCAIYLLITFTITRILAFCEKKLAGNDNFLVVHSATITKETENE